MADSEILFNVDASKILAKLHLGALEACKQWLSDGFFVNTGIRNDNPSAKPDNPGNVEFDLENGEYELGYVTDVKDQSNKSAIKVVEQIIPILNKMDVNNEKANKEDFKKINQIISKNLDQLSKLGIDQKKILDEFKASSEFKEWIQSKSKSRGDSAKNAKIANKRDAAETKEKGLLDKDTRQKIVGDVNKRIDANSKENIKIDPAKVPIENFPPQLLKMYVEKLVYSVQEAGKKTGTSAFLLSSIDDKIATEIFNGIEEYMKVFAGDKANTLKQENVIRQFAPSEVKDSNDKRLVVNYKIVPANDKEIELQSKKNEVNKNKTTMKVCFKIGYTVQIDK